MAARATQGRGQAEVFVPPGQRDALLAEIDACDLDAEAARQIDNQQRFLEELERGLYLRRRLYAESSPEVIGACRRLCETCNAVATRMSLEGNLRGAGDLLKRAEQLADKDDAQRALTWNNLACLYRRLRKHRAAIAYLEKALALEEHIGSSDIAQTHLNLCATLSGISRHADALYHAQSALIRLYEALTPQMLAGVLSTAAPPDEGSDCTEQVTVLCIAYHNLGVEHEYLKNHEAAMGTYCEGLRWASTFLAPGHELVKVLRNAVELERPKLPSTSNALRRADEAANGWAPVTHVRPEAAANGKDRGDAFDLLTPRDVLPLEAQDGHAEGVEDGGDDAGGVEVADEVEGESPAGGRYDYTGHPFSQDGQ